MKYLKIVLGVVGGLAILMGVVWIFQGINVLPGSFMTGDMQWTWRGAILAVVGLLLLVVAMRKPRAKP